MSVKELESYIEDELTQRQEEGYDVTELRERFKLLTVQGRAPTAEELEAILLDLERLTPRPNFPYYEPSSYEGIKNARPAEQPQLRFKLSESELLDRIMGAWLGRAAGCMLGKPVEGWQKERIQRYLTAADAYPLRDYFPPLHSDDADLQIRDQRLLKGNIRFAVRDDDIDYTVLGWHLVQVHGTEFTSEQVGLEWLAHLPYHCVYTAERVAYRNLVNGLKPPETATYRNPYREWIGAQIRADFFGYVAPGDPQKAARMALQDASLSHVKNGIYGEMWVAAMIAGAFCTDDIEEIIHIGLSQIPANSRLAEAIRDTCMWRHEYADWQDAWQQANAKYGRYHPVHTINNAVLVSLALLYSEGDFSTAIGNAVMGGWDCDCNGATTASVMGAMLGASKLPPSWTEPLNDTYHSALSGFAQLRFTELAESTLELVRQSFNVPSS